MSNIIASKTPMKSEVQKNNINILSIKNKL
jgi:hypothetical protein